MLYFKVHISLLHRIEKNMNEVYTLSLVHVFCCSLWQKNVSLLHPAISYIANWGDIVSNVIYWNYIGESLASFSIVIF